MEEYQKRVVAEKEELDKKISKLTAFISSKRITTVRITEQQRLREQREIMEKYSSILAERIMCFK